jgi:hypothetical protein
VFAKIEFSDEETAIIRQKGLGGVVVYHVAWDLHPEQMLPITLDQVIKQKGTGTTFPTPVAASNFEVELKDHLRKLKEYITASGEPTSKSETFEL